MTVLRHRLLHKSMSRTVQMRIRAVSSAFEHRLKKSDSPALNKDDRHFDWQQAAFRSRFASTRFIGRCTIRPKSDTFTASHVRWIAVSYFI
jgi:hypothetical protein